MSIIELRQSRRGVVIRSSGPGPHMAASPAKNYRTRTVDSEQADIFGTKEEEVFVV